MYDVEKKVPAGSALFVHYRVVTLYRAIMHDFSEKRPEENPGGGRLSKPNTERILTPPKPFVNHSVKAFFTQEFGRATDRSELV